MTESNCVIVLDVDGVVVEPWGFATVLDRDFGLGLDRTRGFFSGPFNDCLIGKAELRESLSPFLGEWSWPHSVDEFISIWMRSDDRPNTEVLDAVSMFRASGIRCYAGSNQEAVRASYLRNQMRFSEFFDGLFFSCELGVKKPGADFFRAVEKRLEVEPSAVHFWDDEQQNVESAANAGWNSYLFEGGVIRPAFHDTPSAV